MKKLTILLLLFTILLTGCGNKNVPQASSESSITQSSSAPVSSTPANDTAVSLGEVAWLKMPGTTIDGAVMQASDNDYYLRRNEQGEQDIWGCYFMDYEASPTSKNVIVYGHSLEDSSNGERFSQLKKLNSDAFAEENNTIELSLPDGTVNRYQIFSAGYATAQTDTIAITANPTAEEFQEIVDLAQKRSLVPFGVTVSPEDKILTLSTCTSDENTRYLVVAKLLEEE